MGWDSRNLPAVNPIAVDTTTYPVNPVAEKSGFIILLLNPSADGSIPDYNTRKKNETKITKLL
jgi:hypothetical protein